MKAWVIWLSVITILLTVADCAVHIVEVTTTADVLGRLNPDFSGITELRRAFAAQRIWTAVSAWIILSQIGIIVIVARLKPRQRA